MGETEKARGPCAREESVQDWHPLPGACIQDIEEPITIEPFRTDHARLPVYVLVLHGVDSTSPYWWSAPSCGVPPKFPEALCQPREGTWHSVASGSSQLHAEL